MTEFEELENVGQLVADLEEAEDQIDQLREHIQEMEQANSELQKKNSALSSQVSTLKSERCLSAAKCAPMQFSLRENGAHMMQASVLHTPFAASAKGCMDRMNASEKSEKIVQLNEFDRAKVMEENIILRHQNEALENRVQKVLDETKKRISDSKAYCDGQLDDLKKQRSKLEERIRQEDLREQNMDDAVAKAARQLTEAEMTKLRNRYQDMRRHLESAYQAKKRSLFAGLITSLLYGILVSVFTGLEKRSFLNDTAAGFLVVWGIITKLWTGTSRIFFTANSLRLVIPNLRVGYIVSQVLAWLGYVGGMTALVLLQGIGVYFAVIGVEDYFEDVLNRFAAGTTLAVLIWFGDPIRQFTHCNLFLMWLILQGGYAAARAVIGRLTYRSSSQYGW